MTKIPVKIVEARKKAKLVEDEQGRQGWVQNRSYKDGQVNSAVFEKGVKFLQERKQDKAQRNEALTSHQPLPEPAWESDKALGIDVTAEYVMASSLYRTKRVRLFFPKSQVKGNASHPTAPGWLIEAKVKAALKELGAGWVLEI